MNIFAVFKLFGGLAMLLYGMNVMGDSLGKLGGGKFEKILEKLTSNPVKGVLLGALVTALIQSSSATTVMVVGFVNSGIIKLSQAVGIILGANVGTTITSWLLSLSGIQGNSFIVNLCRPTNFAPILALIGIVMQMFSKSDKNKNISGMLLGFAILMYGMDTMSEAVKPLAAVQGFVNMLTMFENPVLGVLAGAVVTAMIRSSSASVGILQAFSVTGQITFGATIPIVMGENIGTCITALISSIGANKNAKRAAVIHLYINIIGTILFLVVFYSLNAFIHFKFVNDTVNTVNIALVHTIFNVVSAIVLLPFTKQLEKLSIMTIKDDHIKESNSPLDDRFLLNPSYAIERSMALAVDMAALSKNTVDLAIECVDAYTDEKDKTIVENEARTDEYEDMLGRYLLKVSGKNLLAVDSQKVSLLLHAIGDFEEIADKAVSILSVGREIHKKGVNFSKKAMSELKIMRNATIEILGLTVTAFSNDDIQAADKVEPLEEVIDRLRAELKSRHIRRLREGTCTVEMGFIFSDYINSLEKIADHCLNIAVSLIQLHDDHYDTHQYMHDAKKSDACFKAYYAEYSKKYALPFTSSRSD